MSEDERALRARLAALEAEVAAETQAARSKAATQAELERATRDHELEDLSREALGRDVERQARPAPHRAAKRSRAGVDDVADALALAQRAADVKHELTRPRQEHEKSWLVSGGLSLVFGPLGWLYAGSFREAVPAALAYALLLGLASTIIPTIFFMPLFAVLLPLSALAGVVYALTYNRHGERQRLFDKDRSDDAERPRRALPRADD